MRVVGYTDVISAAPGEPVHFMLSTIDPDVEVSLVRLIHGDPRGPGLRAEPVPSSLAGTYRAGPQPLRRGSYVLVEHDTTLDPGTAFSVAMWVMPTLVAAGEQALINKRDTRGAGWSLGLTGEGRVHFSVTSAGGGLGQVVTDRAVRDRTWYFVAAAFDGASGRLEAVVIPKSDEVARSVSVITETEVAVSHTDVLAPATCPVPLLIAGTWLAGPADGDDRDLDRDDDESDRLDGSDSDGRRYGTGTEFVGSTFNGKMAAPRLFSRALSRQELVDERQRTGVAGDARGLAAAWDFARDIGSRRVVEASGKAPDGRTAQMPARAVTGPGWDGQAMSPHEAPDLYDAIHFHDDDLDDACWSPTVEWTVDEGLPSGVYAAHARDANGGEDHVPVIVRPPRGRATARILFVAPLFSWLAYGNVRGLEEYAGTDTEDGRYVLDHHLLSLYDLHSDGSGVAYSSWRRPVLNMRPRFHLPLLDSAHQFSADLHLVDWLHHGGHDFDVVTDEDLHREGADLLNRYQVVLSGSHAEYWSGAMLDALAAYLGDGGRYMYLSGNGLYWVTAFDPGERHTVEVRRHGSAVSAWHAEPGEWHLSTTGELGGLWRWRGRPPQRYVGVGFSGCWATTPLATGAPYRRQPSDDGRAGFVFEGVGEDQLIGAFPNLVLQHGAAGHEVDRADHALGTPPHALVLATATDFPGRHWVTAPEEGHRTGVRADMVFFETPGGGAVFSTGSVAWCGGLSYNDYDNNVSRITGNVLRRFLAPEPFAIPNAPPRRSEAEPHCYCNGTRVSG